MHGRLRVKTTAQQEAERAVERQKKLAKYNAGVQLLFKKRQEGVHDEETALQLSQILAVNPDFYTLWNYRREIFTHWKLSKDADYLQGMLKSELQFTEQCLVVNPKSYCGWHHRGWVMGQMPRPDWQAEVALCDKYLQLDGRNFHCWDYRRLAAAAAGRQPADELAATDRLISTNFSNYSSWHYRSQLLTALHPPAADQPAPIAESRYHQELELVQNAAFTDPDDQAAWFYHRWLLQARRPAAALVTCVSLPRREMTLVVASLAAAARPQDIQLTLLAADQRIQEWRSPSGEEIDNVWVCEVPYPNDGQLFVELSAADDRERRPVAMAADVSAVAPFASDVSAATGEILKQELDNILQLGRLEPNNKWVLLSGLMIMWALDPAIYQQKILDGIALLTLLDHLRTGYYFDLRSRFIVERAIESCRHNNCPHLTLFKQKLTALYHTNRLVAMLTVDVSDNQLTTLDLRQLVSVEEVRAVGNRLRCVRLPGGRLSSLRRLALDGNDIRSVDDLELSGESRLEVLSLNDNPVCDDPEFESRIRERFPELKSLSPRR